MTGFIIQRYYCADDLKNILNPSQPRYFQINREFEPTNYLRYLANVSISKQRIQYMKSSLFYFL